MPTRAPVMRSCMTGRNQITQWKSQLLEGAAGAFGDSKADQATTTVDVKSLHAKIVQLTLENDFFEGALTKAGIPMDRSSYVGWSSPARPSPGG